MIDALRRLVGIVRLRSILETLTRGLTVVPFAMVGLAVVLVGITTSIDARIGDAVLPGPLSTTAESSRAVLGTIAGGLITAFTLLLSMLLVAVQLASSQYSPRSLGNWLGDRRIRWALAVVLGTTVFCLLAVRSVRDPEDVEAIPTITTLVGVLLGILSLAMVIRAVDHATRSLRIGDVTERLVDNTIAAVDRETERRGISEVDDLPAVDVPEIARAVPSPERGRVRQIDELGLLDALPPGASLWLAVGRGDFIISGAPLAWIDGAVPDDELEEAIRATIEVAPSRSLQEDVGFGIAQLTDIAVRALSPGVNDPKTACDVVEGLGEVLARLWAIPDPEPVVHRNGRTLHRPPITRADRLRQAVDPIRRHGADDPTVVSSLVDMLVLLRDEAERRAWPEPHRPIDDMLDEIRRYAETAAWTERERDELERRFRPPAPNETRAIATD